MSKKTDAVMILGGTNSAAIAAERMHSPEHHMEAGNCSFDDNVPEELNSKMVDHLASFNLPYNDYSMRNLVDEGIHPRFIQRLALQCVKFTSTTGTKLQHQLQSKTWISFPMNTFLPLSIDRKTWLP